MAERGMAERGDILLVSCYELGHQPLALASPIAFLERVGFAPEALDISVEPFDASKAARARFVAISVPMHTALRLGVRVAEQIRQINPACHICFYGLYASLNADYLLAHCGDSVIGGEFESALVALAQALEAGRPEAVGGVHVRGRTAAPVLERLPFALPSRATLPGLKKYAHLDRDGRKELVGYVEASRGCLHLCLHCPIPPVYGGRFFVVPRETVLADIRQLEREGATHITFGDPDFLNGPGHSLSIVRAMRAEFPSLTFDFTAKVEHILEREGLIDHVDPVQFTLRLLVPPGSALLTRDAITPYLGPLDQAAFIHRWTHPDPRMDILQREAARLVEAAAANDSAVTFSRLKALAYSTAGLSTEPAPAPDPDRRRPPRLTEAWFC